MFAVALSCSVIPAFTKPLGLDVILDSVHYHDKGLAALTLLLVY